MKYGPSFFLDRLFIKRPRFRRLVTRLIAGDSDRQIELLGTQLTINTVKENGYLRTARLCRASSLLRDELPILINLAALLNNNDTFVDIGANVGLYAHSVRRFKRIYPQLQIYAFEANPDTFARLVAGEVDGIQSVQTAISNAPGIISFVGGAVSHVFTTTSNASGYNLMNDVVQVSASRLDDCNIEGNSLVIKVDVEGQEVEILEGALQLLQSGRIKAIYFDGYKDRKVEEILSAHGFTLLDGRTLKPAVGHIFSLLAIQPSKLQLDRHSAHHE